MMAPTWLITGTSAGFGLALAKHVLRTSHNVVSLSRYDKPHPDLSKLVASLSGGDDRPQLYHLQHDLSNADEKIIKNLISGFLAQHSEVSIDVLVNNAAIAAFAAVETIPTSTVQHLMNVNFYSPLWVIQSVLPNMRESKNGIKKVVVNVSSTQGLCCDPGEPAYETSKHALEAMSGVLAQEVDVFGIRVLVANLGSFRTGFATSGDRAGFDGNEQKRDKEASSGANKSDPYGTQTHPVQQRIDMVKKFANIPNAARGDPAKGAAILFDAIMMRERSEARDALERQAGAKEKVNALERLVIGSDGWPKIEQQVKWLGTQIGSCETLSKLANAEDV